MTGTIASGQDPSTFTAKAFYIDTVVRNLLRTHFRRSPLQNFPGLENVVWSPDERAGGNTAVNTIQIDLAEVWAPDRTGGYPKIMVKHGDLGSTRLGVADRHQSPQHGSKQSTKYYTRAWASSIVLYCLARNSRQSRLIALSSADYLQQFADEIRKATCIERFVVQGIRSTKPLREQPSILATPVNLEYGFYQSWAVTPAAPVTRRIKLTTNVS